MFDDQIWQDLEQRITFLQERNLKTHYSNQKGEKHEGNHYIHKQKSKPGKYVDKDQIVCVQIAPGVLAGGVYRYPKFKAHRVNKPKNLESVPEESTPIGE